MKVRTALRGMVVATILAMLAALLPQLASAASGKASGATWSGPGRRPTTPACGLRRCSRARASSGT